MGKSKKLRHPLSDVRAFHQYIIFRVAAPASDLPVNKAVTVVYTQYVEASFPENAE